MGLYIQLSISGTSLTSTTITSIHGEGTIDRFISGYKTYSEGN